MRLFPETSKQYSAKKCTTVFLFVLADESTCKTNKHAKKLYKKKKNKKGKKKEKKKKKKKTKKKRGNKVLTISKHRFPSTELFKISFSVVFWDRFKLRNM